MSIESYYSVNKTPFLIEGNDKTIARGNIALAYAKPTHTSMSYQIVRLLLQSRTRERSKWFNLTYKSTEMIIILGIFNAIQKQDLTTNRQTTATL